MSFTPKNDEQLRAEVRTRYAKTALQVLETKTDTSTQNAPLDQQANACCGSDCCTPGTTSTQDKNTITSGLYSQTELGDIPLAAALASLGCGNPTALASLKPGEKVLDLGSGGGIDVLLSARRVGPTGMAFGLDMTDAMLDLSERNRQEAGIDNVQFLKGIIEAIPLTDNSVDVIISNCVINLSADKGQVLREAYRVLVPGGRFAVSDIVFQGHLPSVLRHDMELWAGCIAGALEEESYRGLLSAAGFSDIEFEVTRRYNLDEITASGAGTSVAALSLDERRDADGKFVSAFIRARKPTGA